MTSNDLAFNADAQLGGDSRSDPAQVARDAEGKAAAAVKAVKFQLA